MNKRGSVFFVVIIAIFIFAMGVMFMPFFADDITSFREDIDCSNSSISDGAKLTCLEVDVLMPYFIWFIVSIAIGLIAGSKI